MLSVPRPVAALRVTTVVLAALFAITRLPFVTGPVPLWLTVVLVNGVYLCAAVLVVARAVTVPARRAGWALIAAGVCGQAVGSANQWVAEWKGEALPFPSLSDAAWLMFYPLCYCGILVFFGGLRLPKRLLLDGAIAGLGGAALFCVTVVDLVIGRQGLQGLEGFVTLAYPLGDSLLLGTVICGMALNRSAATRNLLLVAGLSTFVVADTLYIAASHIGTFHPGGAVDVLYLGALTLIGVSAWHLPRTGPLRPSSPGLGVAPWFACGALGLLLVATQVRLSSLTVVLAGLALVLTVVRVVAAMRELETVGRQRHDEARRDPLTGLANRRAVLEHLDHALNRPDPQPVLLMLLDLDRFKHVNDVYGHQAGDELLRQVAARLQRIVREHDLLGRLGGDEFVLVLHRSGLSGAPAAVVADRIRTELTKPFDLGAVPVTIDVSIGIAADDDADALFQHADIAMYRAKRAGGGHQMYSPDDGEALVDALRRDVAGDAVLLHFQPLIDLRTAEVSGYEALVRWQHPTLGLLTPDEFLPIAEEHGLMPALTRNVLSQAIRQCAEWQAGGHRIGVSVNVSATDLHDPEFPRQVAGLLERHGLPPEALTLEITETMMLSDSPVLEHVLGELAAAGVVIAIDDYGTHNSSLAHLPPLGARELKLDPSFTADVRTQPRGARIVRSTIDLAHALGITVVAEGIEDAETLAVLESWGCDRAQGYHLGRPAPVVALPAVPVPLS